MELGRESDLASSQLLDLTSSPVGGGKSLQYFKGRTPELYEETPSRAARSISCLENMGRHFGDLARIRHVVTYSLSPFEQKAFPKYLSKGIPNVWRRFRGSFFKIAPPMTAMYLTYTWGNDVFEKGKKKNPADYENDE